MALAPFKIGLRSCSQRTTILSLSSIIPSSRTSIPTIPITARSLSSCATMTVGSCTPRTHLQTAWLRRDERTQIRHVSEITLPKLRSAQNLLDWDSFFRLRMSRRRYSLASSIISATGVTAAAFFGLSTFPETADELTKLVPLDPVISMGLITLGATFLGWLIGPIFGNALWKLLHRTHIRGFNFKERAFFERIKKHRVNPMGASTNNPVPDYYGEKIGSVSGYRRWLKDQRAFNRKREGSYPAGI